MRRERYRAKEEREREKMKQRGEGSSQETVTKKAERQVTPVHTNRTYPAPSLFNVLNILFHMYTCTSKFCNKKNMKKKES